MTNDLMTAFKECWVKRKGLKRGKLIALPLIHLPSHTGSSKDLRLVNGYNTEPVRSQG